MICYLYHTIVRTFWIILHWHEKWFVPCLSRHACLRRISLNLTHSVHQRQPLRELTQLTHNHSTILLVVYMELGPFNNFLPFLQLFRSVRKLQVAVVDR
jgi:hypothetical protein